MIFSVISAFEIFACSACLARNLSDFGYLSCAAKMGVFAKDSHLTLLF
jgi:hypothetical protein